MLRLDDDEDPLGGCAGMIIACFLGGWLIAIILAAVWIAR